MPSAFIYGLFKAIQYCDIMAHTADFWNSED